MFLAIEAAQLFSNVSNKFSAIQDSHLQPVAAALLWEELLTGSAKALIDTMH